MCFLIHTHILMAQNYPVPFTLLSITSFYKCKFWLHKMYSYPNNDKNTFLVLSHLSFREAHKCLLTALGKTPALQSWGQLVPMQGQPAPAAPLRAPRQRHRAASRHGLLELVPVHRSGTQLPSQELAQEQHMPTASWCSVAEEKPEGYLILIYKYSFSYRTLSIVTRILLISKVFWWPYGYCFPQTKPLQAKLPNILYCGGHLLLAPINLIQRKLLTQAT